MRYAVVIEKSQDSYSAYVPDLPGCITTGKTVQETLRNIREAITGHLDALVETNQNIPDPEVLVDYIDIPIPAIRSVN